MEGYRRRSVSGEKKKERKIGEAWYPLSLRIVTFDKVSGKEKDRFPVSKPGSSPNAARVAGREIVGES